MRFFLFFLLFFSLPAFSAGEYMTGCTTLAAPEFVTSGRVSIYADQACSSGYAQQFLICQGFTGG